MKVPDWVDIVKTSKSKELAPYDSDWYYTRCASIARHIYIRSPVGVGTITKIYGDRKRNGTKPSHFCRSAKGLARKALQTLEAVKIIEKCPDGGRKISVQGRRDLDRIAAVVRRTERKMKAAQVLTL